MGTEKNSVATNKGDEFTTSDEWMLLLRVPSGECDPSGRLRVDALLRSAREMGFKITRVCHLKNRSDVSRPQARRDYMAIAADLRRRSEQSRIAGQQAIRRLRAQLRSRKRPGQQ